jgi:hypothetical protein
MNKYIITFPYGGIHAILSSIVKWLTYCVKYNRILIINSTIHWFLDPIQKYIHFRHPNIYKGDYNEIIEILNTSDSVYPITCKHQLRNICVKWKYPSMYMFNDVPLTIDINKDYDEDILVCSTGFDNQYHILLESCVFNPIVTDVYFERLRQLPREYHAIHIRNTDRLSNIEEFIEKQDVFLKHTPFFIASDNKKTMDYFIERYGREYVYSFSNIPDLNGKQIHTIKTFSEELAIDAFVDILLLASAKQYYYSIEKSGYSRLAKFLFENKAILNQLVTTTYKKYDEINV